MYGSINSEIVNILKNQKIPIQDGLSCLITFYFNLNPTYIPEDLKRKVFATGIVSRDYVSDSYEWRAPLFEEQTTGFEWVVEWMDLFGNISKDRRGVKATVIRFMKEFFSLNPSIRKDDVFNATKRYISTVSEPTYLKKSHKFIYEGRGKTRVSMLQEYVDIIKEEDVSYSTRRSKMI